MAASNHVSAGGVQRSSRFTWHTLALVVFFVLLAFLTHRFPQQGVPTLSVGIAAIGIALQWGLFYVAYRGILASGIRFSDVMGRRWSSEGFWSDFKDGLALAVLIFAITYLLVWLGPFAHLTPVPGTVTQWLASLVMAVSYGYTEEVIFRGLLLGQFRILVRNLAAAAIAQAFVFALAHGGDQTLTQFLEHGLSGCLFAYITIRRRSLWPAIVGHVAVDIVGFTMAFLRGWSGWSGP